MAKRKISRREFIKLSGTVAAGAALTSCAPNAPAPTVAAGEPTTAAPVKAAATEPPAEAAAATATAVPAEATSAPAAKGVEIGYYNLVDFEAKAGTKIAKFNEAPMLAEKVKSGALPPVEKRLPDNPCVMQTLDKIGVYGGTLRFNSINTDQDWHTRHINAANLIEMPASSAWDAVSTAFGAPHQPALLEKFGMNEDGTVFTATIRAGLKWSDGEPVTTDDVAFKINDVLLNKELSPTPMPWLVWGGGTTKFEVIDKQSFQITFAQPYGAFIEAEITLWPATFYKLMFPAHYLKKYHKTYAKEEDILAFMVADKYTTIAEWPEFFGKKTALFGCDNTFLDSGKVFPTLNPFIITEDLGNGNYRYERNPYFYMVDQEGNQLPYIDQLKKTYLADSKMEDLSIIGGNTDLSCMSITIDSFPLYKENEAKGNYLAMPLSAWQDQIILFGFNDYAGIPPLQLKSIKQNPVSKPADNSAYDPGISTVYSDIRFRRAMSIALDRATMNETLFLGLGRPAQVAPRPGTPFYEEGMEEAYAQYDPEGAKKLLDEMGMKDVDGDGFRERPDGKPFAMKYDYFVITGATTPASELAKRYWEAVGVKVNLKLVDPSYWWETLMPNNINEATTWWLAGSGANLLQNWFLGPSMLNPMWNNYTTYKGQVSDEDWQLILKYVPEWQREMQDLKQQLKSEPNEEKRNAIGKRMWQLQAEWLPVIGVATDTKAPLIISADLGNVEMAPDKNYNYITVMEASEQWFFKNPARLTS
jgi:peptide/nickel transport system substrate-binding protein